MPTESSPLVGSGSGSRPPLRVIASLLGLVAPAMLGNMLEFYEFGVYVEVTPQLTANFFDNYGDFGRSFGVWFGFSVSFVVRPFGGALFGFIADKFGRRVSIIISVAGMLTCTAGIGLLPTTSCCGAAAGVAGLVLLLLLKLCQGLFVGGEIVATMIYAVESAGPAHTATAAGLTLSTACCGLIMAQLVVGVVETLTSDEQMLSWGWRLPFLLALPWGIAAVVMVSRQHESAEFAEHKADAAQTHDKEGQQQQQQKGAVVAGKPDPHAVADADASPFAVLRRSHKRALGFAVLVSVAHAGVFWGSLLFPKDFLRTADVRTERVALWSTATGMLVATVRQRRAPRIPRCPALPIPPPHARTTTALSHSPPTHARSYLPRSRSRSWCTASPPTPSARCATRRSTLPPASCASGRSGACSCCRARRGRRSSRWRFWARSPAAAPPSRRSRYAASHVAASPAPADRWPRRPQSTRPLHSLSLVSLLTRLIAPPPFLLFSFSPFLLLL